MAYDKRTRYDMLDELGPSVDPGQVYVFNHPEKTSEYLPMLVQYDGKPVEDYHYEDPEKVEYPILCTIIEHHGPFAKCLINDRHVGLYDIVWLQRVITSYKNSRPLRFY